MLLLPICTSALQLSSNVLLLVNGANTSSSSSSQPWGRRCAIMFRASDYFGSMRERRTMYIQARVHYDKLLPSSATLSLLTCTSRPNRCMLELPYPSTTKLFPSYSHRYTPPKSTIRHTHNPSHYIVTSSKRPVRGGAERITHVRDNLHTYYKSNAAVLLYTLCLPKRDQMRKRTAVVTVLSS